MSKSKRRRPHPPKSRKRLVQRGGDRLVRRRRNLRKDRPVKHVFRRFPVRSRRRLDSGQLDLRIHRIYGFAGWLALTTACLLSSAAGSVGENLGRWAVRLIVQFLVS